MGFIVDPGVAIDPSWAREKIDERIDYWQVPWSYYTAPSPLPGRGWDPRVPPVELPRRPLPDEIRAFAQEQQTRATTLRPPQVVRRVGSMRAAGAVLGLATGFFMLLGSD